MLVLNACCECTNEAVKRVILAQNVISMGPSDVLYYNEYTYLLEQYVINLRQVHYLEAAQTSAFTCGNCKNDA